MNWFQRSKSYLKKIISERIPKKLDQNEILVRAIIHPYHYSASKKKLTDNVFLPPPNQSDVSLLRSMYATDSFCKQHAKSIEDPLNENSPSNYAGLATFINHEIAKIIKQNVFNFSVRVVSTPINHEGIVVNPILVFKSDLGLPMHADLVYSQKLEPGDVRTQIRKFARELNKKANYFHDPNPKALEWTGEVLKGSAL